MIDAFLPEGVTRLAVDSIFMMPHLGVLSTVHEKSATEVFNKDCLIPLGYCVAPLGIGKEGQKTLTVNIERKNGKSDDIIMKFGEIKLIPLKQSEEAKVELRPEKGFDVGEGRGKPLSANFSGGIVGLIALPVLVLPYPERAVLMRPAKLYDENPDAKFYHNGVPEAIVTPLQGELVVRKNMPSAFGGTDYIEKDYLYNALSPIRHITICGFYSTGCVHETVIEGFNRYKLFFYIIQDCCVCRILVKE